MAEEEQFDLDGVIKYLENTYFHKNDPRSNDVLKFASDDELKANSGPTEEMKERYRKYVDECISWVIYHMYFDNIFSDAFIEYIERAEQESDYEMFIGCIHGFLDGVDADKAFGHIRDIVMSNYRAETKPPASTAVLDMLKIQKLQERLNNAIEHGAVVTFDEHIKALCSNRDPNASFGKHLNDRWNQVYGDAHPVIYMPSKYTNYGIIINTYSINPVESKVYNTYGGLSNDNNVDSVLDSIDVYLHWESDVYDDTDDDDDDDYEYMDTEPQLKGLCVVPKGVLPTNADAVNWYTSATWPNNVKPPSRPKTSYYF